MKSIEQYLRDWRAAQDVAARWMLGLVDAESAMRQIAVILDADRTVPA